MLVDRDEASPLQAEQLGHTQKYSLRINIFTERGGEREDSQTETSREVRMDVCVCVWGGGGACLRACVCVCARARA